MPEQCDEFCDKQAAAQLLGPLQPNATVCIHGVRRTLEDVFPRSDHIKGGRSDHIKGGSDAE